MLAPLVPWRLERVNVAKQPKRKRAPIGIPYLHRGMCLLLPDGQLVLETEAIENASDNFTERLSVFASV
eukprot:4280389-Amphidinium_carterae.1